MVGISQEIQINKSKWLPQTTFGISYPRLGVPLIFQPPYYTDTPVISYANRADWKGSIGTRGIDNKLYLHDGTKWNLVGGTGGGIGTETDPVFAASIASGITNTNITNWNTAFGWGNHATQGYLTNTTGDVRYYTKTLADARFLQPSALSPYLTSALAASTYLTPASAAATFTPQTRTITINGQTFDLSANRSWTIQGITSFSTVGTTGPATFSAGNLNIPNYTLSGSGGSSTGNPDSLGGHPALYYVARSNHVGTQPASTISDFTTVSRGLFSATGGIAYNSTTGVFSYTATPYTGMNPVIVSGTTISVDTTLIPTGLATKGYVLNIANSKVDKEPGKQLSVENYTTAEKTKLAGVADGATNITNTNQLTNGAGFATVTQLNTDTAAVGSRLTTNTNASNSALATEVTNRTNADLTKRNLGDTGWAKGLTAEATMGAIKKQADSIGANYVTRTGVMTLTGKTIDGDDNTLVDIHKSSLATADIELENEFYIADGSSHTVSGTTTRTALYSEVIPANSLGVNGSLELSYLLTTTNDGVDRVVSVEIGGVGIAYQSVFSSPAFQCLTRYYNKNSLTVGISPHPGNNVLASTGSVVPYNYPSDSGGTINWGVDNTLTVYITHTSTATTTTLQYIRCKKYR